jgi:Fe-S cluster assembly ATPase SufC
VKKKRNEVLQWQCWNQKWSWMKPIPGLDVDAMKLVAEGVNALRSEAVVLVIALSTASGPYQT